MFSLSPSYRSTKITENGRANAAAMSSEFWFTTFYFQGPTQPTDRMAPPARLGQSRDRRVVGVTVLGYEPVYVSYSTAALFRFLFSCVLCFPLVVLFVVGGRWRRRGGGNHFYNVSRAARRFTAAAEI